MSYPLPEHIRLGQTDLMLSRLGIGTWAWGDRWTWGYGKKDGYTDQDIRQAFQASTAAGINFYDTAEVYGSGISEEILGRLVEEHGINQPPLVLATKFFPFPFRISRHFLLRSLRKSLKRLRRESVDLYQMHWPLPPVPIETWMEAMADAVEAGLVHAVGVSNYNLEQTKRACAALSRRGLKLSSNQVKYSLLTRKIERDGLLSYCQEFGISVIAYSPLEMGMLTGKYTPTHPPRGMRSQRYNARYLANIQGLIDALRQIGVEHGGKTPAQVALNWVMCQGAIPIAGAKNLAQASENAGALGWELKELEIQVLNELTDKMAGVTTPYQVI